MCRVERAQNSESESRGCGSELSCLASGALQLGCEAKKFPFFLFSAAGKIFALFLLPRANHRITDREEDEWMMKMKKNYRHVAWLHRHEHSRNPAAAGAMRRGLSGMLIPVPSRPHRKTSIRSYHCRASSPTPKTLGCFRYRWNHHVSYSHQSSLWASSTMMALKTHKKAAEHVSEQERIQDENI